MRKAFTAAAVSCVLSSGALAQAEGPELAEQIDREMLRPTLRIDAEKGPGTGTMIFAQKHGAGLICTIVPRSGNRFCASGALVLTNHHVIKEHIVARAKASKPKKSSDAPAAGSRSQTTTPVEVTLYEYTGPFSDQIRAIDQKAEIVAWDEKRDLALLHIADMPGHLIAIAKIAPADRKPRRHARAWRAGCSGGYEPTIKSGTFQSVDLRPNQQAPLIAVVPIARGDSGGGVYHLNAGGRFEMISVSEGSAEESENVPIEFLSFSITMESVHAFLKESGFGFVSDWHANRD